MNQTWDLQHAILVISIIPTRSMEVTKSSYLNDEFDEFQGLCNTISYSSSWTPYKIMQSCRDTTVRSLYFSGRTSTTLFGFASGLNIFIKNENAILHSLWCQVLVWNKLLFPKKEVQKMIFLFRGHLFPPAIPVKKISQIITISMNRFT